MSKLTGYFRDFAALIRTAINKEVGRQSESDTFKLSEVLRDPSLSILAQEGNSRGVEIDFNPLQTFTDIDCSKINLHRYTLSNVPQDKYIDFSNSNLTEAHIFFKPGPNKIPMTNFEGANLRRCLIRNIGDIEMFVNWTKQNDNADDPRYLETKAQGLIIINTNLDQLSYTNNRALQQIETWKITPQSLLNKKDEVYSNILDQRGNCYGYGDELERIIQKGAQDGLTTRQCCEKFLKKLQDKLLSPQKNMSDLYRDEDAENQNDENANTSNRAYINFPTRIDAYQNNQVKNRVKININDVLNNDFVGAANDAMRSSSGYIAQSDATHIGFSFSTPRQEGAQGGGSGHIIEIVKLEDDGYFIYDSNGFASFARDDHECNIAASTFFRIYKDNSPDSYINVFDRGKVYTAKGLEPRGVNKLPPGSRETYVPKSKRGLQDLRDVLEDSSLTNVSAQSQFPPISPQSAKTLRTNNGRVPS